MCECARVRVCVRVHVCVSLSGCVPCPTRVLKRRKFQIERKMAASSLSLPLPLYFFFSPFLHLASVRNGNELTLRPLPPCHASPFRQTVEKFSQIEKETKCRSILARALSSCCANIISNFSRYFSYLSSALNFLPTVHFDLSAINTNESPLRGQSLKLAKMGRSCAVKKVNHNQFHLRHLSCCKRRSLMWM